jgi:metallo-beta-lactamase family protein
VVDINQNGDSSRIWFSGDIGREGLVLIRDPELPVKADYLIMESTYGDDKKRTPENAQEEFKEVIQKTIQRKGRVIIPAFAVGRTQELVYQLHMMMEDGDIPEIPVFVDSPLAIRASQVFRDHPECFDEETRQFIAEDRHQAALGFDRLKYTLSVEESKAINFTDPPYVVISASGMAETGRILHHLKNHIEDSRNTILIVSWQAPHTLGRRLAEGSKQVKIFGKTYHRRAEVVTINGYSAHAGQEALLEYVEATRETVKQIFLVHGEPRGALPLQQRLQERGYKEVYYPASGEVFDLT